MERVLHTESPWEWWWVMLLESLTVPKPHRDTSEAFQCEAVGLRGIWPLGFLTLAAHSIQLTLSMGFTLVPWNSPWTWSQMRLCWVWPSPPSPQCTQPPPQPVIQGLTPASSSKSTSSQKRRVGCHCLSLILLPTLPPRWQSSPGGLLSSGMEEVEEGIRSRGSPGPDDESRNGGARNVRMRTQHGRSHGSTLVLVNKHTRCTVLLQRPSLYRWFITYKTQGLYRLMPGEHLAQDFQCCNSMFHSQLSCTLPNLYTRTSLLENTTKLARKHVTLLCTRLQWTKPLTSPSHQSEQENWLLKFCFLRVTELDTPKWLTSWWS